MKLSMNIVDEYAFEEPLAFYLKKLVFERNSLVLKPTDGFLRIVDMRYDSMHISHTVHGGLNLLFPLGDSR